MARRACGKLRAPLETAVTGPGCWRSTFDPARRPRHGCGCHFAWRRPCRADVPTAQGSLDARARSRQTFRCQPAEGSSSRAAVQRRRRRFKVKGEGEKGKRGSGMKTRRQCRGRVVFIRFSLKHAPKPARDENTARVLQLRRAEEDGKMNGMRTRERSRQSVAATRRAEPDLAAACRVRM